MCVCSLCTPHGFPMSTHTLNEGDSNFPEAHLLSGIEAHNEGSISPCSMRSPAPKTPPPPASAPPPQSLPRNLAIAQHCLNSAKSGFGVVQAWRVEEEVATGLAALRSTPYRAYPVCEIMLSLLRVSLEDAIAQLERELDTDMSKIYGPPTTTGTD